MNRTVVSPPDDLVKQMTLSGNLLNDESTIYILAQLASEGWLKLVAMSSEDGAVSGFSCEKYVKDTEVSVESLMSR
jgi:hypothetical protein